MTQRVELRVALVARTEFVAPAEVPFVTDADGGQALAEFAGRACYRSWDKHVPATATNAGFLDHVLTVGHLSLLEHAGVTFYVTGISRGAAHELIRHRHFSISQLSPRAPAQGFVAPADLDPDRLEKFGKAVDAADRAYRELLTDLQGDLPSDTAGPGSVVGRKQARQAAAGLIPAAAATSLVITGNYRSWRHFIGTRATDPADVELRTFAVTVLDLMQAEAPHAFADFRISTLPDGSRTAASPLVGEG